MAHSGTSRAEIKVSRREGSRNSHSLSRRRGFAFLVHELPGTSKDVQYEVTRELGRGSEGIVYKARVTSGRCRGRLVALKAHFGKESVRVTFEDRYCTVTNVEDRATTNQSCDRPSTTRTSWTCTTILNLEA